MPTRGAAAPGSQGAETPQTHAMRGLLQPWGSHQSVAGGGWGLGAAPWAVGAPQLWGRLGGAGGAPVLCDPRLPPSASIGATRFMGCSAASLSLSPELINSLTIGAGAN